MTDRLNDRPVIEARKRILVVDDEPDVTKIVVQILKANGFDAWCANDPRTVIQQAAAISPNLIILDFDMPKLLGSELAVLLKSTPETSGIPVIFLSGMTDDDHQTIAAMSGGGAYVGKPINETELIDTIRKILGPL